MLILTPLAPTKSTSRSAASAHTPTNNAAECVAVVAVVRLALTKAVEVSVVTRRMLAPADSSNAAVEVLLLADEEVRRLHRCICV